MSQSPESTSWIGKRLKSLDEVRQSRLNSVQALILERLYMVIELMNRTPSRKVVVGQDSNHCYIISGAVVYSVTADDHYGYDESPLPDELWKHTEVLVLPPGVRRSLSLLDKSRPDY